VESVRNVFEDGVFKYSPVCDKEGRRLLFVQCGSELAYFSYGYYFNFDQNN